MDVETVVATWRAGRVSSAWSPRRPDASAGSRSLVTNAGGPPAGELADFGEDDFSAAIELTLRPRSG